jgi:hypothetical protein
MLRHALLDMLIALRGAHIYLSVDNSIHVDHMKIIINRSSIWFTNVLSAPLLQSHASALGKSRGLPPSRYKPFGCYLP